MKVQLAEVVHPLEVTQTIQMALTPSESRTIPPSPFDAWQGNILSIAGVESLSCRVQALVPVRQLILAPLADDIDTLAKPL